uniref:Uncharacterized protein n=1 Tax=Amphimedon queenslandica TaxID=400682 RepID=A0A1X7TRI7_AMPQE
MSFVLTGSSNSNSHLLLIGVSGAGKTTLSRFEAWINGLSATDDFDDDLRVRTVLRRSGCRDEKIVFIMDD